MNGTQIRADWKRWRFINIHRTEHCVTFEMWAQQIARLRNVKVPYIFVITSRPLSDSMRLKFSEIVYYMFDVMINERHANTCRKRWRFINIHRTEDCVTFEMWAQQIARLRNVKVPYALEIFRDSLLHVWRWSRDYKKFYTLVFK